MQDSEIEFTRKQRYLIHLIACGFTAEAMAEKTGITENTVRTHLKALRMKLRVDRSAELPSAFVEATGEDPFDPEIVNRGNR